jgi:hypothetical protein
MSKAPALTARGVSQRLARAGFERHHRDGRSFAGFTSGYKVTGTAAGVVHVDAVSARLHDTAGRERYMLDQYAPVLEAAGFTVARDAHGALVLTLPAPKAALRWERGDGVLHDYEAFTPGGERFAWVHRRHGTPSGYWGAWTGKWVGARSSVFSARLGEFKAAAQAAYEASLPRKPVSVDKTADMVAYLLLGCAGDAAEALAASTPVLEGGACRG